MKPDLPQTTTLGGACTKIAEWVDPSLGCSIPDLITILLFVVLFVVILKFIRMAFTEIVMLALLYPIWKLIGPYVMDFINNLN